MSEDAGAATTGAEPGEESTSLVSDGGGPLTDAALNSLPPTTTDATGVERIVGPATDSWQPAAVDPDPEQVARHERFLAQEAEARQQRLGALTDPARVDDTAQPLVEANQAADAEREEQLARANDTGDGTQVSPSGDGSYTAPPETPAEAQTSGTPASQSESTAVGEAGAAQAYQRGDA